MKLFEGATTDEILNFIAFMLFIIGPMGFFAVTNLCKLLSSPCKSFSGEVKQYFVLRPYMRQKYYSGHIRWLLATKGGKSVSCKDCGNIANGVVRRKILWETFNIPYCKSHLGDLYFEKYPTSKGLNFPCVIEL